MPESETKPTGSRQQAYDVTIFNPDDPRAGASSAFVETVDAASEDGAREKVVESGSAPSADDVVEVKPKTVRLRVEVSGTKEQMAAALDDLDNTAEFADANVSVMNEDGYVHIDAGDDEDADAYAVKDWYDARMRITGLSDDLGEGGDGMDVSADQLAAPDGTVEFMIRDKVLAKATKEGDEDE